MGERFVVVAPRYPAASERWLLRSIESLGDEMAGLATAARPRDSSDDSWIKCPTSHISEQQWARTYGTSRLFAVTGTNGLRRLCREVDATALLVHYGNLADLILRNGVLARQVDVPILVNVHGIDVTWSRTPFLPFPFKEYGNSRRYRARLVSLQRRVLYVANSSFTRDRMLAAGFSSERVASKPLGVPIPPFRPPPDIEEPNALFVGRLVDFKGPLETIEAFDAAASHGAPGRLVIAGDGPLRRECEQLIAMSEHRSRIDLLGATDAETTDRLYRNATLFTMHNKVDRRSGQEEALGVAHREAMAHGLPVVTGASGGPRETVTDGVDGVLFEPGDTGAHSRALGRLLSSRSDLERMSEAAHRTASRRFGIAAEREVLQELVDGERSRLRDCDIA